MGCVEQIWVLGDLGAMGPDPVGVLERLTGLPNVRCTYGNTERYVLDGTRPWPQAEDVLAEPALMPRLVQITRSFGWTEGALAAFQTAHDLEVTGALDDATRDKLQELHGA